TARLRPATRDRAPARIRRRSADRHQRNQSHVIGDPERRPDLLGPPTLLARRPPPARQPRPQPLVDRPEQKEHESGTCVDEPKRDGPVDLLTVVELVGLAVALVIVVLARADENVDGCALEPELPAVGRRPSRLAHDARDLGTPFR